MYAIMYQYQNQEPEVLDTADTMDEAEGLVDEYTMTFAKSMHETSLWIDDDYHEE